MMDVAHFLCFFWMLNRFQILLELRIGLINEYYRYFDIENDNDCQIKFLGKKSLYFKNRIIFEKYNYRFSDISWAPAEKKNRGAVSIA